MKHLSICLFAILLVTTDSEARSAMKNSFVVTDTVYSEADVDKKPEPVGGMENVYKQVAKIFRYPATGRENGVQGKIELYLTISTKGKITDVSIKKGLTEEFDDEAIRTFKAIDLDWIPGKKDNQKVTTRIVIPLMLRFDIG